MPKSKLEGPFDNPSTSTTQSPKKGDLRDSSNPFRFQPLKETGDPQDKTSQIKDSQNPANARDKAGTPQTTETENKSYLQKLTKVPHDWIEKFKVDNPNLDPEKDRKKTAQYNYAVRIFNQNLRKLEKFGVTKLREMIPIDFRLRGGTMRVESEVLASSEWNSHEVQEHLNNLKQTTKNTPEWQAASGNLMYAYREKLEESGLGLGTQIERANMVRDLIAAGRWSREPIPNTGEYTIGRPPDLFEENQGW